MQKDNSFTLSTGNWSIGQTTCVRKVRSQMKLKMKSFDQKSQLIQQYSLEVCFFCASCPIQLQSDMIKKLDLMSYSAWIGHEVVMLLQTDWWMSGWMVTFSVSGWSKRLLISDVCCMCGSNKHEMCRESIFLSWYISRVGVKTQPLNKRR